MVGRGNELDLTSVTIRFGSVVALKEVSLSLGEGESVAIVGPSGAGKTTLLRLVNGSVRPSEGEVRVGGRSVSSLSSRELRRLRAGIGFVHQDLRLVPTVRVLKNVLAGRLGSWSWASSLRNMVLPSKALTLEAHALLERVGIGDKLYQRTDRLSGGESQRVAVARALFQRPGILVADEPVASVDPERARDTVALFTEVCREKGLSLLMSLHDVDLALELFPRLIGLRNGEIVFDGSKEAISESDLRRLYRLAESPSKAPAPAAVGDSG